MTTRILTAGFSDDTRAAAKTGSKILHHKERIQHKANLLCDLCVLCGKKGFVVFGDGLLVRARREEKGK
jgi:hypothetical protein